MTAFLRFLGTAAVVALGFGAGGCATPQRQHSTPYYTLSHPDFWQVKSVAQKQGEPTTVTIGQYGSAVIDTGSGAMEEKEQNYDAVTADVEARVYGWPEPPGVTDPSRAVFVLLERDAELQLGAHLFVAEQPVECNRLKRKYTVFGADQEPLDMVKRPGYRTIVVGGKARGVLVGVVARVEYEQDMARYCHNLGNMQVQVQNLLDGLVAPAGGAPK